MTLGRISLYYHTIKYLRPVQIYGRLWFRLMRPKFDLSPSPIRRQMSGGWCLPARRAQSLISADLFRIFNEDGLLSEIGWDGPQRDKLWRYNQHYFDDLNAEDAGERSDWHLALLADWVQENPPAAGVGWEPYPTSLRMVNWIKWALAGNQLPEICARSLAVQTRWLTKRLEWHLLGNHLFSNAKALVFAGLFFDGSEADRWLQLGLDILRREIPEQILSDGGQFERSPMYHGLALEDMLDLVNLLNCFQRQLSNEDRELISSWSAIVERMRRWLQIMSHPDGRIGFFNDAAFHIAQENSALEKYAGRNGLGSPASLSSLEWLKDSGYVRFQNDDLVLICDAAPIGPDYLPGHAHADTLSFELSLFGERVLVNSGTSLYGLSSERERQRGTAAHNTVVVDNRNSSEVWSGFRVARRARAIHPQAAETTKQLTAACSHDGYARLPGNPLHKRTWSLEEKRLRIEDHVSNPSLKSEARFHLHPNTHISIDGNGTGGTIQLQGGECLRWHTTGDGAYLEAATWHPNFGASVANECLVIPLDKGRCTLQLDWD